MGEKTVLLTLLKEPSTIDDQVATCHETITRGSEERLGNVDSFSSPRKWDALLLPKVLPYAIVVIVRGHLCHALRTSAQLAARTKTHRREVSGADGVDANAKTAARELCSQLV